MDNRRFRCCEQVFAISELVIWKWVGRSVRPPRQLGRCAARPPRPLTASSAPERGTTRDTLARPAARHALSGGLAGQRRVPPGGPLTCGVTSRRTMICRIYAPPRYAVSRRDAARFRPGATRFRPGAVAFPPGGCRAFPPSAVALPPGYRGVSAGVPRCFRRTAGAGGRAFPERPPLRPRRRSPPPASSQACDPFPGGRPRRDESSSTPAGGQPLTSGPARVRLTRRMTRRSRSIAVR